MNTSTQVLSSRHSWLTDVAVVGVFAALTATSARIAIQLPFTPIPVTLQTLTVILAGLVLGSRRGAASQISYLAAIVAGAPFTAGGIGGPAAFVGPTAGYLVGFVPAAFVVGWLAERTLIRWKVLARLLAALAGVTVIYISGMAWLAVWLGGDVQEAWLKGVVPFVLVDAIKALLAVIVESGRVSLTGTGQSG